MKWLLLFFKLPFFFNWKKCLSHRPFVPMKSDLAAQIGLQSRSPSVVCDGGALVPHPPWAVNAPVDPTTPQSMFLETTGLNLFLKLDCAYKSQGILCKCTSWRIVRCGGRLGLCISNQALVRLILLVHTTHSGEQGWWFVWGLFKEWVKETAENFNLPCVSRGPSWDLNTRYMAGLIFLCLALIKFIHEKEFFLFYPLNASYSLLSLVLSCWGPSQPTDSTGCLAVNYAGVF